MSQEEVLKVIASNKNKWWEIKEISKKLKGVPYTRVYHNLLNLRKSGFVDTRLDKDVIYYKERRLKYENS
jgi:sugar-specific transcriptional regulator TrmB